MIQKSLYSSYSRQPYQSQPQQHILVGGGQDISIFQGQSTCTVLTFDNNKFNDDNKIAIIDNARIINMTPFAAILQASEALSDLSRIPLLLNTFRCP
jgi:hypothetical protein